MRIPLLAAQAALLAGLVWSVLSVPYLPTNDGPQHIFMLHAANHLDTPGTGWSRWLEPNHQVSSYGFSALFTPLDLVLPWRTAVRTTLAVFVALWALGAFALARAVHRERGWIGLAVGAAALQWMLYMGFFSYYAASALGLFALAFALRARPSSRRDLALAILLFVEALLHLVAAAATGAVVAILAVHRAGPGGRIRAFGRTAILGAPAALVAVLAFAVQIAIRGSAEPDQNDPFVLEMTPFWALAKCFVSGPGWRAWPLTLLALASPVIALTVARRGRSASDLALLAAGSFFLGAAALLPIHLPNWEFFSVRFAPIGAVLLCLAVPVERLPRFGRGAVAIAAAGFAFASTSWGAAHHRALFERTAPALAGLEIDFRSEGVRLPIVLDPLAGRVFEDAAADVPFAVPLANLGKLYALAQGGMVPYGFYVDPSIHGVTLTPWGRAHMPPAPDPRVAIQALDPAIADDAAQREAVATYLASGGTRFDDVILWGRPENVDHLLWLGFDPLWRNGGLVLARFRGCPRTLRFAADAPLDDDDTLELGWFPSLETTHTYSLSAVPREADGARVLKMRQSCGALWVRFEDPGLVCEGANAEGRWVLPPGQSTLAECRVVERTSVAESS